jgi:Plant transposon protein
MIFTWYDRGRCPLCFGYAPQLLQSGRNDWQSRMHARLLEDCPMAYWPVYVGKEGKASLVLVPLFWHAAFGFPGTHNDINILDQSPFWNSMLDSSFHHEVVFHFQINSQQFVNLFLLADGIYPSSG